MKKQFWLYLFFFCLFLLFYSCSEKTEEKDFEEQVFVKSTRAVPPRPDSDNCIELLKAALKNAIWVSHANFPEEWLDDTTWFKFEANYQTNTVVQIENKRPYKVFINPNLIQNYGWNGYLLIALHEWFHLSLAKDTTNDQGHAIMVNSVDFHKWISLTLECSLAEAQLLSFAGMENTPIYENIHPIAKMNIEEVMRKYNIKIKYQ